MRDRCNFVSSEYRAMLYSRLETKRKEREARQNKPQRRTKQQKTHEEPKVNTSNTAGSRLSLRYLLSQLPPRGYRFAQAQQPADPVDSP